MTGETAARPMDDVPTRTNVSTLTRRHRDAREVSVDRDRAGDMRAVCVAPSRVEGGRTRETSGARGTRRRTVVGRPSTVERDARARAMVSEEDGDEDDSGGRGGGGRRRGMAREVYVFNQEDGAGEEASRRGGSRGAREGRWKTTW